MYYAGLDVSVKRTAVCIVDATGKLIREKSVNSTPQAVADAISASGVQIERLGLEAGVRLVEKAAPEGLSATHPNSTNAQRTGYQNEQLTKRAGIEKEGKNAIK